MSIVEKAKCLLFDAKLEKIFWAEAVNTASAQNSAVYLKNRSLASGLDITPYELWSDSKPDISNLMIFGSTAMAHVPKEKRLKWDKKSKKHILVGYGDAVKGYRLYDPETKDVIMARNVVIIEEVSNVNSCGSVDEVEESEPVGEDDLEISIQEADILSELESDNHQHEEPVRRF